MSSKDQPHSSGPSSEAAPRSTLRVTAKPAPARDTRSVGGARAGGDRPRSNKPYANRDDRGPRREGGFGGGDRPRFNNDRADRGPRREDGGFGQCDRPSFNRDRAERGPRPERSFGGDRPRFNNDRADRGPRREDGGFGQGDRPSFNRDRAERGPRSERSFGGERPRFNNDRADRGPRREDGGFGQGDRPSFNRDRAERGPRPERSFGGDRPRFNSDRAERPRREDGGFGQGERPSFNRDRAERGPRPERSFGGDRPRFNSDRADRAPRREAPGSDRPRFDKNRGTYEDRPDYSNNVGEARRSFSGIRTYRAPSELGGKAAPIKVIRPPMPAAPREDARPGEQRINKRMAELGMCSRREADEWVDNGWVRVNGEVAVMGQMVVPGDRIEIDDAAQAQQEQQVTILLHKPMGYVSGQAEDGHEPAMVLINPQSRWHLDNTKTHFNFSQLKGLAPCGRLDIDSVGLLVLTQDGRVARQIIGEDSEMDKEYLVRVTYGDREVDIQSVFPAEQLERLRHGLELDGEPLKPAQVDWQNPEQLRFVLTEGKKRQIRRMCELVGLHVVGLKRIRIGKVMLGNLPAGQWRYLAPGEGF